MKLLLDGTASSSLFQPGSEQMFASIRAVASSAMGGLQHVFQEGPDTFSVREWVEQSRARRDRKAGNMLFMPYQVDECAELRSIISMWISIAILAGLRMEPGRERSPWLVIDEVDSLERIPNLVKAVKRIDEFSGQIVLGVNSLESFRKLYREEADVILRKALVGCLEESSPVVRRPSRELPF